ncbi:MAG: 30S ribosomal protein S13 [Candidatus Thermoplasmatota archaeon]|nr:30S ribosomal protein S13 [Candidatus Thermoplasmatota archaeon]
MAKDKTSPEFKYIVRLANTDLDGNQTMVYALAGVKGVGMRVAQMMTDLLGVPRTRKIGDLSDEEVEELASILDDLSSHIPVWALNRRRDFWTGEDLQLIGADIDMRRREDINRLKMIRSYRGIRHETGQKVRGQRTRSNGRTGLTVGVTRRTARAALRQSQGR